MAKSNNTPAPFVWHNFYGATLGSWASVYAETEQEAEVLLRNKLKLRTNEEFKIGSL